MPVDNAVTSIGRPGVDRRHSTTGSSTGRAAPADLVPAGAGDEGGEEPAPPRPVPTGRDDALPLARRIEIVETKVSELVGLDASVERRTKGDNPEDPFYYGVMHDPEGNEFCVS